MSIKRIFSAQNKENILFRQSCALCQQASLQSYDFLAYSKQASEFLFQTNLPIEQVSSKRVYYIKRSLSQNTQIIMLNIQVPEFGGSQSCLYKELNYFTQYYPQLTFKLICKKCSSLLNQHDQSIQESLMNSAQLLKEVSNQIQQKDSILRSRNTSILLPPISHSRNGSSILKSSHRRISNSQSRRSSQNTENSSTNNIFEQIKRLIQGIQFKKFGRKDRIWASKRLICLTPDLKHILIKDMNGKIKNLIPMNQIYDIEYGRKTINFKRFISDYEKEMQWSFSFILRERTLDLQASKKEDQDLIITVISTILNLI